MTRPEGSRGRISEAQWRAWIEAELDKAPPMSERLARATSAILFGVTPNGAA
jgi:hypothetical protein